MGMNSKQKTVRLFLKILLLYFITLIPLIAGYQLKQIGWVGENLALLAAILFVFIPSVVLWIHNQESAAYGLTLHRWSQGVFFFACCSLATLPIYFIVYLVVARCGFLLQISKYTVHCLTPLPVFKIPSSFTMILLTQFFVIALPEEFYFRGFLQNQMMRIFSKPMAIFITALLFALAHGLVTQKSLELLVFFPGIVFGLLYDKTKSILAGTLYHASCNVFAEFLYQNIH